MAVNVMDKTNKENIEITKKSICSTLIIISIYGGKD